MKKFNELTDESQKKFQGIMTLLLKAMQVDTKFRVERSVSNLHIRQSTGNSPSPTEKAKLSSILNKLQQLGFISFEAATLEVPGLFRQVPSYKIKGINEMFLNQLSLENKPSSRKPNNLSQEEWAVIPRTIQQHWTNFSEELRAHIVQCMKEDLSERYKDAQMTQIFGDTLRSPIGMEVPKIPVKLPTGPRDVVYDLEELLKLKKREDPLTREAFELNKILPDPAGLSVLLQRLNNAGSAASAAAPRP